MKHGGVRDEDSSHRQADEAVTMQTCVKHQKRQDCWFSEYLTFIPFISSSDHDVIKNVF